MCNGGRYGGHVQYVFVVVNSSSKGAKKMSVAQTPSVNGLEICHL